MKKLLLLALSLGCAMPVAAPPTPLVALNPEEVKWAELPGTSIVEGQAFLKTRGGDVKYGAGNTVWLIPYSSQSADYVRRRTATYTGSVGELDPQLKRLVKSTTASGDGKFRFDDVAPGRYFVLTSVTWEVPSGGRYSYMQTQGGYLSAEVTAATRPVSIIITR